jgi:hypothetical protein
MSNLGTLLLIYLFCLRLSCVDYLSNIFLFKCTVDIPAAQRLYYDQLFKIADADGDGMIGLNDSAFFKKSGLPNAVLGEVFYLCHFV